MKFTNKIFVFNLVVWVTYLNKLDFKIILLNNRHEEVVLLKIKIIKKDNIKETEVHIYHNIDFDMETKELLNYLKQNSDRVLAYQDKQTCRIYIKDIYYIESVDEKTFLYLDKDIYLSKEKLYEWEERLKETSFIRISKSTILNIRYLKSVKVLFGGRMEATLINNEHLIINRHYLPAFKKKFGL